MQTHFTQTQFLSIVLIFALFSNSNSLNLNSQKSKSSQNQPASYWKQTPWNEYDYGNIWYLDRHELDCEKGVIQGFQLMSNGQISYKYKCKNINNVDNSIRVTKQTQKNFIHYTGLAKIVRPYWSTHYLDRHYVKCDDGFALQKFKLMRYGEEVYYQFNCVRITNYGNCQTVRTDETLGGSKQGFNQNYHFLTTTNYLDRQKVYCAENQFFTGFRLTTRYGGDDVYYTYYYDICDIY